MFDTEYSGCILCQTWPRKVTPDHWNFALSIKSLDVLYHRYQSTGVYSASLAAGGRVTSHLPGHKPPDTGQAIDKSSPYIGDNRRSLDHDEIFLCFAKWGGRILHQQPGHTGTVGTVRIWGRTQCTPRLQCTEHRTHLTPFCCSGVLKTSEMTGSPAWGCQNLHIWCLVNTKCVKVDWWKSQPIFTI